MTQTTDNQADRIAYPVDSAIRACCQGIGQHTPECAESAAEIATTTATRGPVVPLPAGAFEAGDWRHDSAGNVWRHFLGTCRDVDVHCSERGYVRLQVAGDQDRDGSIERYITLNGNESLTAAEARQLARTLIAAADELDGLATR